VQHLVAQQRPEAPLAGGQREHGVVQPGQRAAPRGRDIARLAAHPPPPVRRSLPRPPSIDDPLDGGDWRELSGDEFRRRAGDDDPEAE
jgi:hypothetical protein